MSLTLERKMEIRRNVQEKFAPDPVTFDLLGSLEPPDYYGRDDFEPVTRSVDKHDPPGVFELPPPAVPTMSVPSPGPMALVVEWVDSERKLHYRKRIRVNGIIYDSIASAARALGICDNTIRRKLGRLVAYKRRPIRNPMLLSCVRFPGKVYTVYEAAKAAGVGCTSIRKAVRRGGACGARNLIFRPVTPENSRHYRAPRRFAPSPRARRQNPWKGARMVALGERPRASREDSVLRRRLNRQAANSLRARARGEMLEHERRRLEDDRRREREKDKREIAKRMLRRMLHGKARHPIQLEHEYWLGLKCGWDFTSKDILDVVGIDRNGKPIYIDPAGGSVWRWWIGLNYQTRRMLIEASKRHSAKPMAQGVEDPHENHSTMKELLHKHRDWYADAPPNVPLMNEQIES